MGQCKVCNKKGLFLKLKDGYCEECFKQVTHFRFMIPQWSKHVDESIRLLNETNKPDTFFSRYDFAVQRLNELISSEKYIDFSGQNPTDMLKKLNSQINVATYDMIFRHYTETLKKILTLKTDKSKLNVAEKFRSEYLEFESKMSEKNIIAYKGLYSKLIKEVPEKEGTK